MPGTITTSTRRSSARSAAATRRPSRMSDRAGWTSSRGQHQCAAARLTDQRRGRSAAAVLRAVPAVPEHPRIQQRRPLVVRQPAAVVPPEPVARHQHAVQLHAVVVHRLQLEEPRADDAAVDESLRSVERQGPVHLRHPPQFQFRRQLRRPWDRHRRRAAADRRGALDALGPAVHAGPGHVRPDGTGDQRHPRRLPGGSDLQLQSRLPVSRTSTRRARRSRMPPRRSRRRRPASSVRADATRRAGRPSTSSTSIS